jgi:hypothetical protein
MSVQLVDAGMYANRVSELFRSSMCLGKPLPFHLSFMQTYEDLCIGWYLQSDESHSVVAIVDNKVVGYAFVCAESESLDKWVARRTLKLLFVVCLCRLIGKVDKRSWNFYCNRARDAKRAWKLRRSVAQWPTISVHMNIEDEYRKGEVSLAMRNFIDGVCRESGNQFWVGEVNALGEKRARALSRVVGEVIGIRKNLTLSAVLGEDIRLVTVVREVRALSLAA